MPATTISKHGRNRVIRETLTDRSHVYSVVTTSDDGPEIIFACVTEADAEDLARALHVKTCDISIRDVVPA